MNIFRDRADAGKALATELAQFKDTDCIVLGIPRGGVAVASEIAKALGAPLDVVTPRKIGAPGHAEYAVGAVSVWGESIFVNSEAIKRLGISESYIQTSATDALDESRRRLILYRGTDQPPLLSSRTVIVVDDGVATGYTVIAALSSLRSLGAEHLVLAVPVGPPDSIAELSGYADQVICPLQPPEFRAVGNWYREFEQLSDTEVLNILERNRNQYHQEDK